MEFILIILVLISLLVYLLCSCANSQERFTRQLLHKQKVIRKMQDVINRQKADKTKMDLQLHDKLGANLSALNLHMNVLKKHIPEQKFQTIHNLLTESIQETRCLSKTKELSELLLSKN